MAGNGPRLLLASVIAVTLCILISFFVCVVLVLLAATCGAGCHVYEPEIVVGLHEIYTGEGGSRERVSYVEY